MSFSASVKEELCSLPCDSPALSKAECYGLLLFGRAFQGEKIALLTENEHTARRYQQMTQAVTGVPVTVEAVGGPSAGRFLNASVEQAQDRETVLGCFGHTPGRVSLRINRAVLEEEGCPGAFLRGAFLSCGALADPEKEYHLELYVPFYNLACDLQLLLAECSLAAKMIPRKGGYVLYFKESEAIEDFLTLTGAVQSAFSIMNIKIYKDLRNNANRRLNCDSANIDKTVAAAAEQIADIRLIDEKKGLSSLPEDLMELARLRLNNPELSLRELGEQLSVPISRSGVNHRLRRLHTMALELREKSDKQEKGRERR